MLKQQIRTLNNIIKKSIHESQSKTFDDRLILINNYDQQIGDIDKKTAHLNTYIYDKNQGKPHRAFSVFLFNEKNELLIHKRSKIKITFPDYWTNTCCSHPLNIQEHKQNEQGCKIAAAQRVLFELNYKLEPKELILVDKLIYQSKYDEIWGEYELDYVFFVQKQIGNMQIKPNENEIEEIQWIKKDDLQNFLKTKLEKGEQSTPWFNKIVNYQLYNWWSQLEQNILEEKQFNQKENENIIQL